jgi:murein peptide amidase A
MKTYTFGYSSLGLPIIAYEFINNGPEILVLGGVHGDEIEGVWAGHGLLKSFLKSYAYKLNLTLIPQFNIEGVLNKTRQNSRGIDLNRNLPTKDWSPEVKNPRYHPGPSPNSEPENQSLVKFIEERKPKFILSLHSWHPMLNINGDCRKQAEAVSKITGYRIDPEMGYPTPGALGTFAGKERHVPTLTYEIERGLPLEPILRIHVPAILEMLKTCEE